LPCVPGASQSVQDADGPMPAAAERFLCTGVVLSCLGVQQQQQQFVCLPVVLSTAVPVSCSIVARQQQVVTSEQLHCMQQQQQVSVLTLFKRLAVACLPACCMHDQTRPAAGATDPRHPAQPPNFCKRPVPQHGPASVQGLCCHGSNSHFLRSLLSHNKLPSTDTHTAALCTTFLLQKPSQYLKFCCVSQLKPMQDANRVSRRACLTPYAGLLHRRLNTQPQLPAYTQRPPNTAVHGAAHNAMLVPPCRAMHGMPHPLCL
jgi:hypothetical protein